MNELKDLRGKRVVAVDGTAGVLNDVYFDAAKWKVRYIAVDTGLRRASESLLFPAEGASFTADGSIDLAQKRGEFRPTPGARSLSWLFTGRETTRYDVEGTDGPAGEIDELLVLPDWSVGGFAVLPRDWLFGGSRVILSPTHIAGVDRGRRRVTISLSRVELLRSPRLAQGSA